MYTLQMKKINFQKDFILFFYLFIIMIIENTFTEKKRNFNYRKCNFIASIIFTREKKKYFLSF